ncbi:MAG: hypothetical protein GY732_01310 [Gammaproteobacteria bacterium]|nr:hypothetical protein [Gammaproteobacteria bacterium]
MARRGRPTKYKPEMCDEVIEIAKTGVSKRALAATLGIANQTMLDWCNPENPCFQPKFSDAVKQAEAECYKFWEETTIDNLKDKDINVGVLALIMRNMHKWDQKQQVEVTGANGAR